VQRPVDYQHIHDDLYTELFVSASIYPYQGSDIAVEVRRGMIILTSEGLEAGRVAAITIDRRNQQVTNILLGRLSQRYEYRLVPISIIEQVLEEKVLLCIFNQVVNTLPMWRGS
jgi:sporulation protein YlmC with PRC-barrel domain